MASSSLGGGGHPHSRPLPHERATAEPRFQQQRAPGQLLGPLAALHRVPAAGGWRCDLRPLFLQQRLLSPSPHRLQQRRWEPPRPQSLRPARGDGYYSRRDLDTRLAGLRRRRAPPRGVAAMPLAAAVDHGGAHLRQPSTTTAAARAPSARAGGRRRSTGGESGRPATHARGTTALGRRAGCGAVLRGLPREEAGTEEASAGGVLCPALEGQGEQQ